MIAEIKAEQIARAYIENGFNSTKALRACGYKDSPRLHNYASTFIRHHPLIQKKIRELTAPADVESKVIGIIQGIERTARESKDYMVQLKASQIILDLAGVKVQRKVRAPDRDLDSLILSEVEARIENLKQEIAEKE